LSARVPVADFTLSEVVDACAHRLIDNNVPGIDFVANLRPIGQRLPGIERDDAGAVEWHPLACIHCCIDELHRHTRIVTIAVFKQKVISLRICIALIN
jgi:hypothetical protein